MPKSAARRRKQPSQRFAHSAARAARSPLPRNAVVSEVVTPDVGDNWDELEDEISSEPDETEELDAQSSHAPVRGRVSAETIRRGQVPHLLQDVISARIAVVKAERDLAKKVRSARSHGATWEDIGLACGMTRQGAAKRFG